VGQTIRSHLCIFTSFFCSKNNGWWWNELFSGHPCLHKYLPYLCSELVHPRLGHAVVAIQKNDYNMMFGLFCREFMMFNVKHCISSVREKNEKLLLVVMNTKQRFSSYMILHALQHQFPSFLNTQESHEFPTAYSSADMLHTWPKHQWICYVYACLFSYTQALITLASRIWEMPLYIQLTKEREST